MSTHKYIDRICLAVLAFLLIITVLFINGSSLGIQSIEKTLGYENRLFNTDNVHTIDIVIDDWDEFLSTAQSEEYSNCSVVIDGEAIKNVGIRGKGNTSLSNVASMNSDRYSFKIEFDHYDDAQNYYGLDKLSLNNVIQDNTYMKDYLVYQMMKEFGVNAPLCSYVYITVNGEDWGLYLAVEGVEDSFLQRNYGSDYGELYKPDSLSFAGGGSNGKDFNISDFTNEQNNDASSSNIPDRNNMKSGSKIEGFGNRDSSIDEETLRKIFEELELDETILGELDFKNISMDTIQSALSSLDQDTLQNIMNALMANNSAEMPDFSGGMSFMNGMSSSDVKLQYIDDDPNSYSNIFDNAKTNVTASDKERLIAALKQLADYQNIEEIINVDEVIRYFVVHNFVVNDDSYTGSMIHNYYLYEEDGQLSMIPWDYNLAFGTFTGGNAFSAVNDDIDDVLEDRPMQAWIFSSEEYSNLYYEYYEKMLEEVDVQSMISDAYELIADYVKNDPTAFCTYEEFESGVETLKTFIALRSQSVKNQLDGSDEKVDAVNLDLSLMGTMSNSMNNKGFNNMFPNDSSTNLEDTGNDINDGEQFPNDMQTPAEGQFPEGMEIPNGGQMPSGNPFSEGNQFENESQADASQFNGFLNNMNPSSINSSNGSVDSLILCGICIAVLICSLLFAVKFKRRK